MALRPGPEGPKVRVRVWFGTHAIADHAADPASAERYAAAMSRRFAGLRVTSEPLPPTGLPPERPLPNERLWGLPPT
jgi:hypothetical protein